MELKTQKVQVWVVWLFAVLATTMVPVTFEIYPDGGDRSQPSSERRDGSGDS